MAKKSSFCLGAIEKILPLPMQYKKVIYELEYLHKPSDFTHYYSRRGGFIKSVERFVRYFKTYERSLSRI